MRNYLVDAIKLLKPNAEFSITEDDYQNIKWDVLDGEAPTKKEIDAAIKQVKLNEVAEAKAKVEARAAAQAKLAALGLTVEDLTALGL
jgi:uncharacterized protein (DUF2225 family)